MNAKGTIFCKTLHQRLLEQFLNHLIEREAINSSLLKQRRPTSRAVFDQILWNAIWG